MCVSLSATYILMDFNVQYMRWRWLRSVFCLRRCHACAMHNYISCVEKFFLKFFPPNRLNVFVWIICMFFFRSFVRSFIVLWFIWFLFFAGCCLLLLLFGLSLSIYIVYQLKAVWLNHIRTCIHIFGSAPSETGREQFQNLWFFSVLEHYSCAVFGWCMDL